MKLSPLQLLHSRYEGISLIAAEVELPEPSGDTPPYPEITGEQIHTDITLGSPPDESPKQFVVRLSVDNLKLKPDVFPYLFAAKIEGVFQIDHDGELEERRRLVVVNGTAMLYGMVREQLLTLSSRHKHGPMQLPSLDFRVLTADRSASKSAKKQNETSNKKSRKASTPA